jgi:hypothetical protein
MSSVRGIIKTSYLIGDASTADHPALISGSMAADITGPVTEISKIDQVCYQVSWTSSDAVGTISVQGSVDGVTFSDLTFSTPLAQPNSNNGSYLINLALIPFPYIRLFYDRASGSGSMEVYISAKGF